MRNGPTILHLDMDAYFASVEQAAKPSLRGKPVVVGGLGPRGVVATASYEARVFGVHSAMPTAFARRRAPHAAYLVPRFALYREISEQVMAVLGALSPLVEPLSLDEAFVDLAAGPYGELLAAQRDAAAATELVGALAADLRADIAARTGLTASVGAATSKLLAKIASEEAKPDGLVVVPPGRERETLGPMPVRALPGVGPATAETLRGAGLATVAELAEAGEELLVRLLGRAHGAGLFAMAEGRDDRPVVAERDAKSVSVEDTFDTDLVDPVRIALEVDRLAERCTARLRAAGRTGRTVVVKVRRFDFSTLTRSETLGGPTDEPGVVRAVARRLAEGVDPAGGLRLLGVGVTGLADYAQQDLFTLLDEAPDGAAPAEDPAAGEGAAADDEAAHGGVGGVPAFHPGRTAATPERRYLPGQDVRHEEHGPGWVQGSGLGRVTVRFEEPGGPVGRVRTFAVDDPALAPSEPLPLVAGGPGGAAVS